MILTRWRHRNFGGPQTVVIALEIKLLRLPIVEAAGHRHAPGVMIVIIKNYFVICKVKKWREGSGFKDLILFEGFEENFCGVHDAVSLAFHWNVF